MAVHPVHVVHKQGYLFKQGTFFSSWNERYYSLETSLLKQFSDADSAIPSYSIYLGSAAVEGIFPAASNDELGYGAIWSFVLRWPLPSTPDMLEEQWGFMHIGSYNEKEIDEWYDSLSALIRVEQTKRLMSISSTRKARIITTPPDFMPVPSGFTPTLVSPNEDVRHAITVRFSNAYDRLLAEFNSPSSHWFLVSSRGGMLYRNKEHERCWKFCVSVPKSKATAKRVWESVLSAEVAAWAPMVKDASAAITDQKFASAKEVEVATDKWTMRSTINSDLMSISVTSGMDRVAFKDPATGVFFVLGMPNASNAHDSVDHVAVDSVSWAIVAVSDDSSTLSVYVTISAKQASRTLTAACAASLSNLAEAIVRPSAVRIREFILSQ